jgi:hypothetical protein
MPVISDSALAKIENAMASANTRYVKLKEKYQKEETIRDMKMTGEALGSAAIMGFLRGKYEQADGTFNLPYVAVDAELAIGMALLGGAYLNLFGKFDEDFASAGLGVMSHYVGQIARKTAKTGTFSMIAGSSMISGGGANALAAALGQ